MKNSIISGIVFIMCIFISTPTFAETYTSLNDAINGIWMKQYTDISSNVSNLIELEWNDIFKTSLINFIIVENKKDIKIYKIQNYDDKSYMISSDGLVFEIRDKNNVYKYEYNFGNINDSEFDF